MGDQDQCHRKNNRQTLKLKLERPDGSTSFWYVGGKIYDYQAGKTEEQEQLRAYSQKLAENRQFRSERVEKRRRLNAAREADDRHFAERRREKWIALVREAADIGLKPDPSWTEREFRLEIWHKKQEIRREEEGRAREEYWAEEKRRTAEQRLFWQRQQKEEAARFLAKVWERSVARSRLLKALLGPDDVGELWEYIPHIVKFGTFDRDPDSWGFGREHRSISRIDFPARNPQTQRRTWEAAAPRRWRRKDQCAERWDHLFSNDPAAE